MYQLQFKESFLKALDKLGKRDASLKDKLWSTVEKLAERPRPVGAKKLSGEDNIWRVRVGDYRILYTIDDRKRLVILAAVGPRGSVYR